MDSDLIGDVMAQLFRAIGLHRPLVTLSGDAMSLSDAMALSELRTRSSMSQQDLADVLRLEKSTVSRLVLGLERKGWLTRRRAVSNRRYQVVELTPHGRRLVDEVAALMRARHDRLLRLLSVKEQDALRTGVSGLVRAMSVLDNPNDTT